MQDVVAHVNASAKLVTGQAAPPPVDGDPPGTEEMAELLIAEEKGWPWEQIHAEFARLREPFLGALGAMQEEPVASAEADLGDLGVHPTHILGETFAFDVYCHLRHDIVGAATAVNRELPEPDDLRVRPGIDWMLAGLPFMCRGALAPVATAPIEMVLTGPGGGTWLIGTAGDDGLVRVTEGAGEHAVRVTSSAHDFYSWGTQRSDWRDHVTVEGDADLATGVLDAINVI